MRNPEKSLPKGYQRREFHSYVVVKELPVFEGETAPWFGQPGGGTQYYLPDFIPNLIRDGYLEELIK